MEPQTQPLVCPSHTKQYIGAVILGILIGAAVSFLYFMKASVSIGNAGYQSGIDEAKKRIEEHGLSGITYTPDDIRAISGTVTAINGNRITIRTRPVNPFEDPLLDGRIIIIATTTKISKLSLKDSKTYQSEIAAYTRKMGSNKDALTLLPPEPFVYTVGTIVDITTGDNLNVVTLEIIKGAKEFSVDQVQIQSKSV